MLKHFSIINILIIIGLIALGYFGYEKYINDKVGKFHHSELPIYIQQKYFKPCKK